MSNIDRLKVLLGPSFPLVTQRHLMKIKSELEGDDGLRAFLDKVTPYADNAPRHFYELFSRYSQDGSIPIDVRLEGCRAYFNDVLSTEPDPLTLLAHMELNSIEYQAAILYLLVDRGIDREQIITSGMAHRFIREESPDNVRNCYSKLRSLMQANPSLRDFLKDLRGTCAKTKEGAWSEEAYGKMALDGLHMAGTLVEVGVEPSGVPPAKMTIVGEAFGSDRRMTRCLATLPVAERVLLLQAVVPKEGIGGVLPEDTFFASSIPMIECESLDDITRIKAYANYLMYATAFEEHPHLLMNHVAEMNQLAFNAMLLCLLQRGVSAEDILNSGILHVYAMTSAYDEDALKQTYKTLGDVLSLLEDEGIKREGQRLLTLVTETPIETVRGFHAKARVYKSLSGETAPEGKKLDSVNERTMLPTLTEDNIRRMYATLGPSSLTYLMSVYLSESSERLSEDNQRFKELMSKQLSLLSGESLQQLASECCKNRGWVQFACSCFNLEQKMALLDTPEFVWPILSSLTDEEMKEIDLATIIARTAIGGDQLEEIAILLNRKAFREECPDALRMGMEKSLFDKVLADPSLVDNMMIRRALQGVDRALFDEVRGRVQRAIEDSIKEGTVDFSKDKYHVILDQYRSLYNDIQFLRSTGRYPPDLPHTDYMLKARIVDQLLSTSPDIDLQEVLTIFYPDLPEGGVNEEITKLRQRTLQECLNYSIQKGRDLTPFLPFIEKESLHGRFIKALREGTLSVFFKSSIKDRSLTPLLPCFKEDPLYGNLVDALMIRQGYQSLIHRLVMDPLESIQPFLRAIKPRDLMKCIWTSKDDEGKSALEVAAISNADPRVVITMWRMLKKEEQDEILSSYSRGTALAEVLARLSLDEQCNALLKTTRTGENIFQKLMDEGFESSASKALLASVWSRVSDASKEIILTSFSRSPYGQDRSMFLSKLSSDECWKILNQSSGASLPLESVLDLGKMDARRVGGSDSRRYAAYYCMPVLSNIWDKLNQEQKKQAIHNYDQLEGKGSSLIALVLNVSPSERWKRLNETFQGRTLFERMMEGDNKCGFLSRISREEYDFYSKYEKWHEKIQGLRRNAIGSDDRLLEAEIDRLVQTARTAGTDISEGLDRLIKDSGLVRDHIQQIKRWTGQESVRPIEDKLRTLPPSERLKHCTDLILHRSESILISQQFRGLMGGLKKTDDPSSDTTPKPGSTE